MISWRDGSHQYLRLGTRDHLFFADPGNFREVRPPDPERLRALRDRVDEVLADLVEPESEPVGLDDALRDQLEALGYLR